MYWNEDPGTKLFLLILFKGGMSGFGFAHPDSL